MFANCMSKFVHKEKVYTKLELNPVYNFNNNDAEKDRLVFDKIDFEKWTFR